MLTVPIALKLKPELLAIVTELYEQPLEPPEVLKQELDEYLSTARRTCPEVAGLAERISTRALELFLNPGGVEHLKLAQAAIKYLLKTDDAKPDFTPGGLDDDLEVFNAVAAYLGRQDLQIPIRFL